MIKIRISIDWSVINNIISSIIRFLIIKRAYKGYVWFVKMDAEDGNYIPSTFNDYKLFSDFLVRLGFKAYFIKYKKVYWQDAHKYNDFITFSCIMFNK